MELDDLDRKAACLVEIERMRQNDKWGDQRHTAEEWMAILKEELAEANCAIVLDYPIERQIKELTECAAVLNAWLKDLMRKQ